MAVAFCFTTSTSDVACTDCCFTRANSACNATLALTIPPQRPRNATLLATTNRCSDAASNVRSSLPTSRCRCRFGFGDGPDGAPLLWDFDNTGVCGALDVALLRDLEGLFGSCGVLGDEFGVRNARCYVLEGPFGDCACDVVGDCSKVICDLEDPFGDCATGACPR